ncbi:MAG: helix-turn-helix transcriptional regulator [Mobilitalea sp.]
MKLVLDSEYRNAIGYQIKTARLGCKMTQMELSVRLETLAVYIDRASISKLEQKKRIVTDIEILALSKVLNVSIPWLFGLEK